MTPTVVDTLDEADWIKAVTLARHGTLDTLAGLREPSRRHYGPGPHKSGTPQSVHGANFGDTVHPVTGRRPTTGYQVGQPTGSMIIPRAAWKADDGQEATRQFVLRNKAVFDADPDAFMGVWLDKAKQEIDLDVSHNVLDLDTAMDMARQWDQQAIWDNVNARVIPVGGTGAREYAESRHQAPEGLLDDVQGGAARLDQAAAGRGRPRDPEVVAALDRFYRHLAGQHDQKSHGRKGGGGALEAAEAAGQRTMKPITSAAQLDARQRASLDEAWEPWTRTRQDTGEKVTLQIDRAELKSHVADTIRAATPEQRAAGMRWYQDAHDWGMGIAEKYDMDPETVFKVTSALSPKTGWEGNKTKAEKIIRAYKNGDLDGLGDIPAAKRAGVGFASGTNSNATQAVRILRGEQGLPTGLKRQSFVNNMHHPENGFDITVDGWVAGALQRSAHGLSEDDALAWVNRGTNQAKTTGLVVEGKGYIAVADVVREVAGEMGMSPQQAQAVYWVASGGGTGAAMWENES